MVRLRGIGYVIGLARNKVLERAARDEIERAQRQFQQTGRPQRIFGSFSYAAGSWDRISAGHRQGRAHDAGPEPAVRGGERAG